jgi:pimeloyl-ACP methyl ester carboxylesterase
MYCADPLNLLFNDVPTSVGESWLAKMKCQPASGWADVVKYAGWKDVPSAFLVCENDTVFPAEKQLEGANMAGSEIEKCNAGHMVWLSQPETVVGFVRRAAGEEL